MMWCERRRDFGPSAFRNKLNEIDEWCPHPLRRSPRCIVPADSRHLMNTGFSIVVYMYQLIRHGPWNLSKNDQAGGEDIPISMPCMSYWLSMVVITEWSCRVLSVYFAIYQKEKKKEKKRKVDISFFSVKSRREQRRSLSGGGCHVAPPLPKRKGFFFSFLFFFWYGAHLGVPHK